MFIFKRTADLRKWIAKHKEGNTTIGFVPTMGALHQGHISLIEESKRQSNYTIVSVFVNPRQFNDQEDLKKYPRPIEEDIRKIHQAKTDVLFIPDVNDMYPAVDEFGVQFDPGDLGNVMEGKFRPGHFSGVADVVYRLLKMITPDKLFLGQKDFQQVAIIRKLIADQHLPVEVVVCPTFREENGLAMSSRNLRLTDEGRKRAGLIYQTLQNAKKSFEEGKPIRLIEEEAMNLLAKENMQPEYFQIVDGHTLMPVQHQQDSDYVVACAAVKVDGIRLIDNLILKEK
jgi:pantoate--beta-alanine ligase